LRQGRYAQGQGGDEKHSGHDGGFYIHTAMKKFMSDPDAVHGSCNR
jgi:hypothetical protein